MAAKISGWYTPSNIVDEVKGIQRWHDAEYIHPGILSDILDIARQQVEAYAPKLEPGQPIPPAYRQAQLMQAQTIWAAAESTGSGDTGAGEFVIRPFPLDWNIKQMLRPRQGVPVIR